MKIEIPYLAAVLIIATDLMTRIAVLGVEQALFSQAIEWSMNRLQAGRRKLFSKGASY